jgi:hypothetical protein
VAHLLPDLKLLPGARSDGDVLLPGVTSSTSREPPPHPPWRHEIRGVRARSRGMWGACGLGSARQGARWRGS